MLFNAEAQKSFYNNYIKAQQRYYDILHDDKRIEKASGKQLIEKIEKIDRIRNLADSETEMERKYTRCPLKSRFKRILDKKIRHMKRKIKCNEELNFK